MAQAAGALVLGFVAATAVIIATEHSDDPDPGPATVIGAPDFDEYCRVAYGAGSAAVLLGRTSIGWRCTQRPNGIFTTIEIDFDLACRERYGDAVRARSWDEDDAHSWECITS